MAFDIEGARKAGYSDQEIADHLGKQSGFDVAGARKSGYSDAELISHLSSKGAQPAPQPAATAKPAPASKEPGMIESAAAGAGAGVGNAVLNLQKYIGKAVNFGANNPGALGALAPVASLVKRADDYFNPKGVSNLVTGKPSSIIDRGTQWLVNDAERGQARLQAQNKPYADANPISNAVGKVGGEIALTLPVGGAVGNVVKNVGARAGLPVVQRLGTAIGSGGATTGGAPVTLAQRAGDLGLRALGGGINGAVTTSVVDPENVMSGAVVGAGVPVAFSGARGALHLGNSLFKSVRRSFEPLNQANDPKIIGRVLREQAGPEADQAVAALRRYQQTGSQLPGYQPSGAEVARVPSLASMQRTATAINPIGMNRQAAINASNQDAILRELDDLAGRGGERAFSDAMREETAQRLYDKAFSQPIDPARVPPELQDKITSLLNKPAMQAALQRARELAKNEGLDIADPAGSLRGLHYSLQEIGGMVGDAKTRNEKRILMGVKNELTSILDKISPDYATARAEYEALSRPLDQFGLLEKIAQGSTTGKGNATLSKFGTVASDKTAKAFTTKRNATLSDVLTPQQLTRLGNVRGALEGIDFVGNAGRGTGSDTVAKMATANRLPGAGWMSRVPLVGNPTVGLLNRGLDAVYSNANRRLEEKLSLGLLDPAQTLSFLEAAPAAVARQPGLLATGARKALPLAFKTAPLLLGQ